MCLQIPQVNYSGMDSETLQVHKKHIQELRSMCERKIESNKQQIKALNVDTKRNEQMIIQTNNELLKIAEAEKQTDNVIYEPVIIVNKKQTDVYTGPVRRMHYSKTDGRSVIVYYFGVFDINVLGSEKGMRLLCESKYEYTKDEKVSFIYEIVEVAKEFNVKKIYLADNVKINTTLIKREIPDMHIQVMP